MSQSTASQLLDHHRLVVGERPARAVVGSTTLVKRDLPCAAVATTDPVEGAYEGAELLLVRESLTFEAASTAIDNPWISGVAISNPAYPDHARKMLQEAGKALVLVHGIYPVLREGGTYQIDNDGVIDLGSLPVTVSAICSSITEENAARYRAFNVSTVGYFRFKFCLFEFFAEQPGAFTSPDRITTYLESRLQTLLAQGWSSIRCVLSDPTSAELEDLGLDVLSEPNPEMGVRGPRELERWRAEITAVSSIARANPDRGFQVSVPFIASGAEYGEVLRFAAEIGFPDNVAFGLTVEVPSMLFELEELLATYCVGFIAIGTSDLFGLLNGVDRSNRRLSVSPTAPANVRAVHVIADVAALAHVPFFVCGEIRKNARHVTELIRRGCTELVASSSVLEIATMNRIAAASVEDVRPDATPTTAVEESE